MIMALMMIILVNGYDGDDDGVHICNTIFNDSPHLLPYFRLFINYSEYGKYKYVRSIDKLVLRN